ncbi:uncharacterized protein METZ01_LOCUS512319, partial [marine metagenome]
LFNGVIILYRIKSIKDPKNKKPR